MFGQRINEFDNSDGTLKSFNKIFPKTTLGKSLGKYVDIGGIVQNEGEFGGNPFVRYLKFYDKNWNFLRKTPHDFGKNNFVNNEDFLQNENIRFKYYAKDLNGNLIGKSYNIEDLANKLGCKIGVVKNRLVNKIDSNTKTKYLFNVKRIEL